MRNCLGLSICTLIVLLVFTTVEGGTDFPQKCLENFRIYVKTEPVICINGNLTNVKINNLTCPAGELLYIDDFVLSLSRVQNRQCLSLGGFNYNQTITASCLNREYKDISKDIALVLMSSYTNISEVQSSLNRIVLDMYMLSVEFHCRPVKSNFIDICNKSSQEGWVKGFIKLDTKALKEMEKPPSYCSCSIISSENKTKVSAVDVRLSSSETFKSYQDNDDSGSDVFPKDSFLWKINGQQEINSNFITLTLSLEKETPKSLWIEIEGSNMNISCSPIIVNGTGLPQPQKPNTAGPEIEIIVGTAIGGFVVLVGLIFLIVFLITRIRSRTQHGNLTKSAPSASFSEIKEAIYAEPQTPVAEKKTLLVSSNYMELEKNIYAEPGPANNNFKSDALPSPPYKDEESENLVPNNIYNHLGEQPAPSQIHIYDTTGSHEYSTTFDRKNKPKIINNIYDR